MKINSKIAFEILELLNNNQSLKEYEASFGFEIKETRCHFYQAIIQLVDSGCLEYKKRCYENYYYWWYEMPKGEERQAKKTIFTCDIKDFIITHKAKELLYIRNLEYYQDQEYKYWKFYDFILEYDRIKSQLCYYNTFNKYKEYFKINETQQEYIKEIQYIMSFK